MRPLRETYERQARSPALSDHWSGPPQMVDRIARTIRTSSRHRVLDVGCGVGGPARRLVDLVGCEVVGIDVVEPVVRAAGRRGGGVRYVVATAEAIPLASASVDQTWMLGALAHAPDLGRALAELVRVLRPGGRLVATEAFWETPDHPRFLQSAPLPWRPLTAQGTGARVASAGFIDVRILDWPADGVAWPGPTDPRLAADLAAGRLRSRMIVATRRRSGVAGT
jgi:SAM-dependent methyltransferase